MSRTQRIDGHSLPDEVRYIQNGRYVDNVTNPAAYTLSEDDRADDQLENARRSLTSLAVASNRWPELVAFVDRLSPLVDRADDYYMRRDDARAQVATAARERDAAARMALAKGEDPEEAEEAAGEALSDAQGDAEKFARYYRETVRLAAQEAARGDARLKALRKEAAPDMLVASLRKLETVRREALAAVAEAHRKLSAIPGMVVAVRAAAHDAPGSELGRFVDNVFDPHARRLGGSGATYADVLGELENVKHRLAYATTTNPVALGHGMGAAVRYAVTVDGGAAEVDDAIRADVAEHQRRVAMGEAQGPFRPRGYRD